MRNKIKYEIDIDGLKEFLQSLTEKDFQEPDGMRGSNPNGIIKIAHTITDIEFFKLDKSKYILDTVIFEGMPFLCDVLGNDLSIIELSKKIHKLPNGRKLNCKFIETVIFDCHEVYGTALNNQWVIPQEFINYK